MYSIFWFRRDLRIHDNAGLYYALKSGMPVKPVFIFDQNILEKLSDKKDARVSFIHTAIANLKKELRDMGSDLEVYHGRPEEIWNSLLEDSDLQSVFTNRDYEQYAIHRDNQIAQLLEQSNKRFHSFKDHVIFEMGEIVKDRKAEFRFFFFATLAPIFAIIFDHALMPSNFQDGFLSVIHIIRILK